MSKSSFSLERWVRPYIWKWHMSHKNMAFASPTIIVFFEKLISPYRISTLQEKAGLSLLNNPYGLDTWRRSLVREHVKVITHCRSLSFCKEINLTSANFIKKKMADATAVYRYLQERGILVYDTGSYPLCQNCLRITIGTRQENTALLAALRQYEYTL